MGARKDLLRIVHHLLLLLGLLLGMLLGMLGLASIRETLLAPRLLLWVRAIAILWCIHDGLKPKPRVRAAIGDSDYQRMALIRGPFDLLEEMQASAAEQESKARQGGGGVMGGRLVVAGAGDVM